MQSTTMHGKGSDIFATKVLFRTHSVGTTFFYTDGHVWKTFVTTRP